ncbi:MAG: hypothetical protein B7Z44_06850, partial [Caulobacter sp. 12-67-6]
MKRLASGAALTVLALAASSAVYAQETTAAVRGSVTGEGGAPVAGAAVTILHTPSGTRSTTVSGSNGTYDARGLRVGGPYEITVQAPGLESKKITDVYLTLADTQRVDVDLAANAVDAVVVTASVGGNDILVSQNIRGDGGISIAGSNPRTNRLVIDGVAAQDPYGLETGGLPTARGPISLDAVEQFSISSVPTDVENGSFTGGALNIVLRSGGNDFHGSAFINYLNEGLVGKKVGNTRIAQQISQKNYGGFLSGPIWKDTLFFAGSYEKYETQSTTNTGPVGAGFANSFANNLTQAKIDEVVGIYNSGYASDFAAGSILRTTPVLDEKYSAKIDWNINDQHRASLSYRRAESAFTSRANLGTFTAALDSQWYDATYLDEGTTLEINSDWTDRLSTTVRATYRDWVKGQMPKSGQNYSDVTICTAPTADAAPTNSSITTCATGNSSVRFGPDQF